MQNFKIVIEISEKKIKSILFSKDILNTKLISKSIVDINSEENLFLSIDKSIKEIQKLSGLDSFSSIDRKQNIEVFILLNIKTTKIFNENIKIELKKTSTDFKDVVKENIKKIIAHILPQENNLSLLHVEVNNLKINSENFNYQKIQTNDILEFSLNVIKDNFNILSTINLLKTNLELNIVSVTTKEQYVKEIFKVNSEDFIILDIDENTLSISFFENSNLIGNRKIPIGFNHLYKDVSTVCEMEYKEAVKIVNVLLEDIFTTKHNEKKIKFVNKKLNQFVEEDISKIKDIIYSRIYEFLYFAKNEINNEKYINIFLKSPIYIIGTIEKVMNITNNTITKELDINLKSIEFKKDFTNKEILLEVEDFKNIAVLEKKYNEFELNFEYLFVSEILDKNIDNGKTEINEELFDIFSIEKKEKRFLDIYNKIKKEFFTDPINKGIEWLANKTF